MINQVSLIGSANLGMPASPALDSVEGSGGMSFGDVLKGAVQNVDTLNNSAGAQINNMLQGGSGDMTGVMVAVEKADVSFQLMMQVRNKIVSAYQDIEKMQF